MSFVKTPVVLMFLVLPILAAGCTGKKVEDPEVARQNEELAEIYDSYQDYAKRHQRPPKQLSDLTQKDMEAINSIGVKALKEGRYVAVWGVDVSGKDSEKVVAYEKDALKQGGAVLMANGKTKHMSADELQAALKSK